MVGLWMSLIVLVGIWKLPDVQRALDRFSSTKSTQNEMIQELYDITGQRVTQCSLSRQLKKRKANPQPPKPSSKQQSKQATSTSGKTKSEGRAISGLLTQHLNNTLLYYRDSNGQHHTYTQKYERKLDLACTYECVQCRAARRDEIKDENTKRYTCTLDGRVTEERGNHHPDCMPLTIVQVAVSQICREEEKYAVKYGTSVNTANHRALDTIIFEVAEQFGLPVSDILPELPAYNKRRKIIQRKLAQNTPKVDSAFSPSANYTVRPFDSNWYCASDEQKGLAIFATTEDLEYLAKADDWVMDGTFDLVPKGFTQMFVVHAKIHDQNFHPAVHVLMRNREATSYERVFDLLKKAVKEAHPELELNPKNIITDFEGAMRSAIKLSFPKARLFGCLFHFAQAIVRKLFSLGLKTEYMKGKGTPIYDWARKIIGLPLVGGKLACKWWQRTYSTGPNYPPGEKKPDALKQMIDYLLTTWFGENTVNVKYVSKDWEQLDNDGQQTTNVAEGYNSRSKRGAPKHATFPVWMKWMLRQHATDMHTALRWSLGKDFIAQKHAYAHLRRQVEDSKVCMLDLERQLEQTPDNNLAAMWNACNAGKTQEVEYGDKTRIEFYLKAAWEHFIESETENEVTVKEIRERTEGEVVDKQLSQVQYYLADPKRTKKEKLCEKIEREAARDTQNEPKRKRRQWWSKPRNGKKRRNECTSSPSSSDNQSPLPDEPGPSSADDLTTVPWYGEWWRRSCTIDNVLMALHTHLKKYPNFLKEISDSTEEERLLLQVLRLFQTNNIQEIRRGKGLLVKHLWRVQGLSVIEGQINLGDNEGARLLELFRAVWEHREQRICDSVHCPGRVTERRGAEYLIPARCDDVAEAVNNLLKPDLIWENYCGQEFTAPPPSDAITMQSERHNLATGYSVITYSCYGRLKRSKIQFVRGRAPWMLPVGIQQLGSVRRSFSDLPEEITIPGNHRYERVAITMHNSDHYTAILRYKAGYRLYDGMIRTLPALKINSFVRHMPQYALYMKVPA